MAAAVLVMQGLRLGGSATVERRKALLTPALLNHVVLLVEQGESVAQVARSLRVGWSTLYDALAGRA